ncbi:MAG: carbohydrate kinase [Pseudomonadota bacterium]
MARALMAGDEITPKSAAGAIICCGEALIDMLPRPHAEDQTAYLPVAGGAVFNTAIALGRLDQPTGFVSGVSTDVFGELLVSTLEQSNVATGHVVRSARPTTLAFVSFSGGDATYTFYDEGSAGRVLSPDDLPALPDDVAALHFGAISLIPEPCGTAYETLLMRHAGQTVISLDPNIRSNFIDDPAAHRARILRMAARSDMIKVSDDDLAWLAADGDPQALIRGWLEDGTAIVTITRGSDGVTAVTPAFSVTAEAVPVTVADTIGAGDAFNAGFLAALRTAGHLERAALRSLTSDELHAALAYASEVAALTVAKAGADPPWAHELSG